mmetsp:Transcript_3779/g.8920  ORF Transcript_3779/g.8920 Transcript_3779/m.8920 type:complete len:229 (-) Transcript_3779:350-1036(-)
MSTWFSGSLRCSARITLAFPCGEHLEKTLMASTSLNTSPSRHGSSSSLDADDPEERVSPFLPRRRASNFCPLSESKNAADAASRSHSNTTRSCFSASLRSPGTWRGMGLTSSAPPALCRARIPAHSNPPPSGAAHGRRVRGGPLLDARPISWATLSAVSGASPVSMATPWADSIRAWITVPLSARVLQVKAMNPANVSSDSTHLRDSSGLPPLASAFAWAYASSSTWR